MIIYIILIFVRCSITNQLELFSSTSFHPDEKSSSIESNFLGEKCVSDFVATKEPSFSQIQSMLFFSYPYLNGGMHLGIPNAFSLNHFHELIWRDPILKMMLLQIKF